MDKKIFSFLFSTRLMAVLFLVFAAAMAAGTFIEDAYNTDTARIIIYNSWWFEAIMVFFVINFIGNIKRYQLYKKEKWSVLLLHLAFIFVLIGAFITRYISYEGMMPIREGETESRVYSDKPYLTAFVDGDYQGEMKRKTYEKALYLSPVTHNNFTVKGDFNSIPFTIEYEDYVMNGTETIEEDENGELYLKMVESGGGSRHDHFLKEGEVQNIHNVLFAFNKYTEGAINVTLQNDAYFIQSPFEGDFMRMADQYKGNLPKDSVQVLFLRSLYNVGGAQFVFPEMAKRGKVAYVSNNNFKDKQSDDILMVKVKSQGQEEKFTLVGSRGKMGIPQTVTLGKLDFTLFFGSKVYELPFSIKLEDFIADKYPGTEKSYSAYKSKLSITDNEENKVFKDSVFMNHILDYRGFRFFQAGFDPDEKGTNLSVNHDFWGTWITYIGYTLLYFGLIMILFGKNTRFGDLKRKIKQIKNKKKALTLVVVSLFTLGVQAQGTHEHIPSDEKKILELLEKYKVSPEHAEEFGKVVIQDQGGRMKPINTFASELLRKVSKSDTYKGMDADQAFISMTQFPQYWFSLPVIYLKRGNDSIRKIIGVEKGAKYASLIDFFDEKGNYKLASFLDDAYREAVPNQFQKDFIDADQKVNLLHSALSGDILKVFPIPNDPNNKWVSFLEINEPTGTQLDSIKNIVPFYLDAVTKSAISKDYKLPNSLLTGLQKYQKTYGAQVMLSDKKIETEVLYNKYDIFKKLHYYYLFGGIIMLVFTILQLFYSKKWINAGTNLFHGFIFICFILHTLGLIARWYISGHAPWSNAYESMIYVGWATMLFGLIFGKSKMTVASTAFVASMILMVAHLNWLDPQIGNLQPVLNSYWLMIHVAVIVASYGPFTLGMILGLVALFLMIFTNSKNKSKIKLAIAELSYINEMALTIGLVMLTIGNFLGGQWANESWGRYWGWDPKETWALISIMVYAFVIHARLVPGLRGRWAFNFMSVLAFASIVMTYVGVNFHLSGLHSYASGERQNVTYYFYILIVVIAIGLLALSQYRKHLKSK
ncbi:cytochrome C biogenesis protein [Flavobacterium sediminis]|uniref:Cytochrome C biogenesis protein n=1 Tax=Flavobacterium sediminis TaxID=2201181 RepID=A0A2U8QWC7_9FLAO|nr:cytochrome c biogenesis protein CcsA [Flavobacterium sediminis]AWM14512.1 cytochrome C biogenesis protein [Flavobacterium sediminis]